MNLTAGGAHPSYDAGRSAQGDEKFLYRETTPTALHKANDGYPDKPYTITNTSRSDHQSLRRQ